MVVVGRGTETIGASVVTFFEPTGTNVSTRDVALRTGVKNVVPHSLGRTPTGRIIVYQDVSAIVWDGTVSSGDVADSSRYLALYCSADVIVRLWVWLCLLCARR